MVPLPGRETGESLRQAFLDRWVSWAGMPAELVVDPSQANLREALTTPLALSGTRIVATAADAHWQLGKVEVHGGWFSRVLSRVMSDVMPHDKLSWQECVTAAHCKNEFVQVYGMTPAQHVFGRNPRVPTNLLDEPCSARYGCLIRRQHCQECDGASSGPSSSAGVARQQGRRLSLAARPRKVAAYSPGEYVAYWRTQKYRDGVLERGGRWCGPAIVLGFIGRNVVVVHKKHIMRCAPEQLRYSTSDEQQLAQTPGLELLGIKNLVESGALKSSQYEDLVNQPGPPASPVSDAQETEAVPEIIARAQGLGYQTRNYILHELSKILLQHSTRSKQSF